MDFEQWFSYELGFILIAILLIITGFQVMQEKEGCGGCFVICIILMFLPMGPEACRERAERKEIERQKQERYEYQQAEEARRAKERLDMEKAREAEVNRKIERFANAMRYTLENRPSLHADILALDEEIEIFRERLRILESEADANADFESEVYDRYRVAWRGNLQSLTEAKDSIAINLTAAYLEARLNDMKGPGAFNERVVQLEELAQKVLNESRKLREDAKALNSDLVQ